MIYVEHLDKETQFNHIMLHDFYIFIIWNTQRAQFWLKPLNYLVYTTSLSMAILVPHKLFQDHHLNRVELSLPH